MRPHSRRLVTPSGRELERSEGRLGCCSRASSGLPDLLCGVEEPSRLALPLSRRLGFLCPTGVCAELRAAVVDCTSTQLSLATSLLDRSSCGVRSCSVSAQYAPATPSSACGSDYHIIVFADDRVRRSTAGRHPPKALPRCACADGAACRPHRRDELDDIHFGPKGQLKCA